MERKIVQYRLVVAEYYTVLEQQVNALLAQGWQPHGSLLHQEFQLNPDNMNQAKIKKAFVQPMAMFG